MQDEQLIAQIRQGNADAMDAIFEKYKGQVRRKARSMFLVGGDTDDLIQEGMIGLYKAVRDFEQGKEASFSTFAEICIARQMYTAINSSMRKKNVPLNNYVSISNYSDGIESENIADYHDSEANPEQIFIDRENVAEIKKRLKEELSTFEHEVYLLYLEGVGYLEIANRFDRSPKSIDNAIQRIKAKAIKILKELK
ncbi:MAG: sigma-70 family RNA polymerase sigma factor [Lachnospiraceae bacterium]|nr:sigma-70 family RNA polymerase sigma factor [Lachnospiraceae bacterium]